MLTLPGVSAGVRIGGQMLDFSCICRATQCGQGAVIRWQRPGRLMTCLRDTKRRARRALGWADVAEFCGSAIVLYLRLWMAL